MIWRLNVAFCLTLALVGAPMAMATAAEPTPAPTTTNAATPTESPAEAADEEAPEEEKAERAERCHLILEGTAEELEEAEIVPLEGEAEACRKEAATELTGVVNGKEDAKDTSRAGRRGAAETEETRRRRAADDDRAAELSPDAAGRMPPPESRDGARTLSRGAIQALATGGFPSNRRAAAALSLQYCRERGFHEQVCASAIRTIAKESRFDPWVRNKEGSSAFGLGQYINSTWTNECTRFLRTSSMSCAALRGNPQAQLEVLLASTNQRYVQYRSGLLECRGLNFDACNYAVYHHSGSWRNPQFVNHGFAYYQRTIADADQAYRQAALDLNDPNINMASLPTSRPPANLAAQLQASRTPGQTAAAMRPSMMAPNTYIPPYEIPSYEGAAVGPQRLGAYAPPHMGAPNPLAPPTTPLEGSLGTQPTELAQLGALPEPVYDPTQLRPGESWQMEREQGPMPEKQVRQIWQRELGKAYNPDVNLDEDPRLCAELQSRNVRDLPGWCIVIENAAPEEDE